jgi:hypothetical protein
MPAKAGICVFLLKKTQIPAFAGMTALGEADFA